MRQQKIIIECDEDTLTKVWAAVRQLATVKECNPFTPATAEDIERARELYQENEFPDIEIDDNAGRSGGDSGDGGHWVQAWVWLEDEEEGGDHA
jgi:hypothetical protein